MKKKKVDHLLQNGELYVIEDNTITIKNEKYEIELEVNLGLDTTGDTVQAVILEDELYIENLGKVSKIKIGKRIKE